MKVLFLTNLFPYPLDNGGKIKTYSTLRALRAINCEIDLVCFSENIAQTNENRGPIDELCRQVEVVPHKLSTKENIGKMFLVALKSIASRYPYIIYKYKNRNMHRVIKERLTETAYDIVYFDHLQIFLYFDILKRYMGNAKIVIDQHNCESQIIERTLNRTENVARKLFLWLEYKKTAQFENKSLSLAEKVFVLSKQDLEQMEKLGARLGNVSILPIAVMDSGMIKKDKEKQSGVISLLFVGTLTWNPNDEGICWFMENVVPLLRENDILYKLYIVGKNPSIRLRGLCAGNPDVTVTGYVEDITVYYRKADVMIVPLFIGGGQRVKIIEAFSKGIPVISTTIGAEGLKCRDGQEILIADDVAGFIQAIKQMADGEYREKIATSGRTVYERQYSIDSYCIKYKNEINSIWNMEVRV